MLLAKQLSSVTRLSGGRLTAGLGIGGWPADYAASGVPLGGTGPVALTRAATAPSNGWVAPLFGLTLLRDGINGVLRAWADARREGRPRIVTGRYFGLGVNAETAADH